MKFLFSNATILALASLWSTVYSFDTIWWRTAAKARKGRWYRDQRWNGELDGESDTSWYYHDEDHWDKITESRSGVYPHGQIPLRDGVAMRSEFLIKHDEPWEMGQFYRIYNFQLGAYSLFDRVLIDGAVVTERCTRESSTPNRYFFYARVIPVNPDNPDNRDYEYEFVLHCPDEKVHHWDEDAERIITEFGEAYRLVWIGTELPDPIPGNVMDPRDRTPERLLTEELAKLGIPRDDATGYLCNQDLEKPDQPSGVADVPEYPYQRDGMSCNVM